MLRRVFAMAMLATLVARAGRAQVPPAQPDSNLTVTLITFGLGSEVFERFGHNALWFHNTRTGEDVAYHWGLFSFSEPHFIQRFLTGDNHYWMGPESASDLIERERVRGRPATLQRLNLTPQQAGTLREFVRWNQRPENAFYRYDYFQDNCSTRLRDALDMAVGGAIKRATDTARTALSFRRESVRLTDGDKPLQLGIDIALGRPADKPITVWQSFFIPMRLRDALHGISIVGANGALVPIVAAEQRVTLPPTATPIPELVSAPRLAIRYFALGALLAAIVVGLRAMSHTRRSATWGLALFGATWSLLCGVLGIVLLFAWLATKHVFWVANENVLLLTPLSLFLVVLIPAALLSGRFVSAARMVATLVAAMAVIAAVMSLYPGVQENRAIVALMLPVHLALLLVLRLPVPERAPRISA